MLQDKAMDLNRRNFLKVAGLTAAGSILPGCEREVHHLVPYLLPDDEIVPGVDTWYASVCRECDAGCGIIVRTMEGRAKKIEGNPHHPVNGGKLCAHGQAALQGLYNPDRIRGPLKRVGARGDVRFDSIGWDEALALWVDQLGRHGSRAAMISRPLPGTLGDLLSEFMHAIDGEILFYDPSGAAAVRTAHRESFGLDQIPHYDLAHTDFLLSFGAPFLEHWLSPVAFGIAYGEMRHGRPGIRGRVVQIEPRLSLTAANADRWLPVRPGTEGLLAIGIGQVILREGPTALSPAARKPFERWYASYSLDRVAAETDVPEEEIIRLAREFARASAPLAIGGGFAAAQTNGTSALMAVNALNLLVGNVGKAGGLQFFARPPFPPVAPRHHHDGPNRIAGEQAILDFTEDFRVGRKTLLHLYDTNPLFTLPPSTRVQDLFEKAEYIVSFSSFMDESTAMADLILPDHFSLESWSDHPVMDMCAKPIIGLAQPVVTPLYETRAMGDVFLEASRRLKSIPSDRFPWYDFRDLLQARWNPFLSAHDPTNEFDAAWTQRLQQGGWWHESPTPLAVQENVPSHYDAPVFAGDETEFPFYFYSYPSPSLGYGHGANRPWLQELPDPLTTAVWGSWVEINPQTAKRLGLLQGEIARVISEYGEVQAPVVLFPGVRPDVISMPIGQGHQAYGRYAKDRGANPLSLLSPAMDRRSGCLATGSTRVRLEGTGQRGRLVLLDQPGKSTDTELITIKRAANRNG